MSRYDCDENPDEIRDSTVRRPAESSGEHHTSEARGQGGGSLHQRPPQRELRAQEQTLSPRTAEPREPNPTRERAYGLRDSEVQTLADIGAFRAIKTEDLVQHRYAGDARQARRDLKHLVEQGLVQTRTTYTERNVYVGLTRKGRRYIEHSRPANTAAGQVFYHGFVKRREARHDAAIYRLYQRKNQRLTQAECKGDRAIIDLELKGSTNPELQEVHTYPG